MAVGEAEGETEAISHSVLLSLILWGSFSLPLATLINTSNGGGTAEVVPLPVALERS